jgi:hypothetical protein
LKKIHFLLVTARQLEEILDAREKQKRKTIAISSFSFNDLQTAVTQIGCKIEYPDFVCPIINEDENIAGYEWKENMSEDHQLQREGYMDYLNTHLASRLPRRYHIIDVAMNKKLLTLDDPRIPYKLVGGTDVIITSAPKENALVIVGTAFVIKLKNSQERVDASYPQAIAQLVSADAKNCQSFGAISVLTDLNNAWIFFWFSENKIMQVLFMKNPKIAFDFIVQILAQQVEIPSGSDIQIPGLNRPLKKVKFDDICPPLVNGSLVEQYENLELLKGDFTDDIDELFEIERQQHDILTRESCFSFLQCFICTIKIIWDLYIIYYMGHTSSYFYLVFFINFGVVKWSYLR